MGIHSIKGSPPAPRRGPARGEEECPPAGRLPGLVLPAEQFSWQIYQAALSSPSWYRAPPEWQGVCGPIVFPCGNLCLLKAHMHLLFPRLQALCAVLTARGRASPLLIATGAVTGDLSTLDHHSGREGYSCDHSHAVM